MTAAEGSGAPARGPGRPAWAIRGGVSPRRVLGALVGAALLVVGCGTGGAPRNGDRTPRSADARAHAAEFGLMRVRLERTRATFTFVGLDGRARDRLVAPILS
jgi:hypothetical protein